MTGTARRTIASIAQVAGLGEKFDRGVIHFADYVTGVVDVTGATDYTTNLNAALAALYALGGGKLMLPTGTILASGQLVFPNDGATPPKQPSIGIVGCGAHWSGRGTSVVGGTTLLLGYGGAYGQILTSGLGLLTLRDVTLKNAATSTTPMLYTTNTTLHISGCAFVGTKAGVACDQDAIVLGGLNQIEGGGALTDGFQGYGTVISDSFFSGIRTCVKGQAFANAVVVRDNTVWTTCGNPAGAAIEWNGQPAAGVQWAAGCVITGNLIEVPNYKYAVSLTKCTRFSLVSNNVYDKTATTTAAYYVDATSLQNVIYEGYTAGGIPALVDASGTTFFYATTQGSYSIMPPAKYLDTSYPLQVAKLRLIGGDQGCIAQPAVAVTDAAELIKAMRSAAEVTDPGATVFSMQQNGTLSIAGPSVQMAFKTSAGVSMTRWTGSGRYWSAEGVGGLMRQDSGTGGSYFELRNYGVKFLDNNAGPLRVLVGGGVDGIKLGATSDAILQRDSLGQIASNVCTKTRASTTATRPTAASVGAGAQMYDTTLSKPIWSDGTVWRDASGTAV